MTGSGRPDLSLLRCVGDLEALHHLPKAVQASDLVVHKLLLRILELVTQKLELLLLLGAVVHVLELLDNIFGYLRIRVVIMSDTTSFCGASISFEPSRMR